MHSEKQLPQNAKILYRILFTVLGMSTAMTFIGDLVGNGFHSEMFSNWLTNWSRNFLIVPIAESLVIQPIARFVMVKQHESVNLKSAARRCFIPWQRIFAWTV